MDSKNRNLAPDVRERIRMAVRENPGQMTLQLARDLDVSEVEVVRALPAERVTELDINRWEELLQALEPLGKVHVIVSNGAATLEAKGAFGGFSKWGDFFNVQTDTLDMHIRWRNLQAAFAVEKPSHMNEAVTTLSIQFFDDRGGAAFKIFVNFGGKAPAERAGQFAELRERFRKE